MGIDCPSPLIQSLIHLIHTGRTLWFHHLVRDQAVEVLSVAPGSLAALAGALRPYGLRGDALTLDAFCEQFLALAEARA